MRRSGVGRARIRTVTALASIPLLFDAAEARVEARVDATGDAVADAAEDALIAAKVRAATDYVERFTGQVLTPRTLEMACDRFPCLPELVSLPRDPVTAIVSVAWTDAATGAETSWTSADWRWSDAAPDQLLPAWRMPWPVAAAERGSVRIRFDAGYDAGLAPPGLVAAVKAMFVHLYDNRSAVESGERAAAVELPLGVRELCMPYRRLLA